MPSDPEPIQNHQSGKDSNEKSDPQRNHSDPNISGSSSISPSLPAKHRCEITHKKQKTRWDKFKDGAEIFGIGLLLVYTIYTIRMYDANRDAANAAKLSADVARDTLIATQGPFVVEDGITITGIGKGENRLFLLEVRWRNTGASRGINVTTHSSYEQPLTPLTKDFGFADKWDGNPAHEVEARDIAAHGDMGVTLRPALTAKNMRDIGTRPIYLWGWYRYRDTFKDTPEHVTKFCSAIVAILGNPFGDDPKADVKVVANDCPFYSCTNEQCKE